MAVVPDPLIEFILNTLPAVRLPVGSVKVYDCPAECAGDRNFTPCEFCEQFSCSVPSVVPSPFIDNPALDEVETKFVFAFVTVLSLGVPMSSVFPNTRMKSIESLDDKVPLEGKNVIVEPETEKAVSGACITPFKETNMCKADSGTNATPPFKRL